MSSIAAAPTSPSRPKYKKDKEKRKDSNQSSGGGGGQRLKTIVRRLPANLPEEVFWQSVQAWVSADTATWKVFQPGKLRKRVNKENIPSRAYIAFKNEESLAQFSREYDGHIFRDKAGNESQVIVEFAPYQKVPPEKKKADARNATIDKDEDYISFLESLKAPSGTSEPISLEALIAASHPPEQPKTTPLLEALKAQKAAQKDKEAIIRNHPHYKEAAAKKEVENKKGKAAAPLAPVKQAQALKAAEPPTIGKRAAKKAAAAQRAAEARASGAAGAPAVAKATAQASTLSAPPPPTTPSKGKGRPQQLKASMSAPPQVLRPVPSPAPSPAPRAAAQSNAEAVEGTDSNVPASVGPPARRGRPVIGLASRHFEAALSGAVGPGERRARKEREHAKEGAKEGESSAAPDTETDTGKAKDKGGGRRDEKAGAAPVEVVNKQAAVPEGKPQPAPLSKHPGFNAPPSRPSVSPQPPRIMPRPADGPVQGGIPPAATDQFGSRGGRRGRGRGRGGFRGSG